MTHIEWVLLNLFLIQTLLSPSFHNSCFLNTEVRRIFICSIVFKKKIIPLHINIILVLCRCFAYLYGVYIVVRKMFSRDLHN